MDIGKEGNVNWTATHYKNVLYALSAVFAMVAVASLNLSLDSPLAALWGGLGLLYLGIAFALRARERRAALENVPDRST